MSSILLVTSSPRGAASHSSRIATELAAGLQAARPGSCLVVRDLAAKPLPHIGADFAAGIRSQAAARSPAETEAVAESDAAVAELLAADSVVIAAGLINFGIPSTLKAWLDHVARAGQTFRYSEKGPEGLVTGRRVHVVIASGGIYSEGPAAALDHAVPYLRTMLGFLGMTDIELVRIEGVALGGDAEAEALARARAELPLLAAA